MVLFFALVYDFKSSMSCLTSFALLIAFFKICHILIFIASSMFSLIDVPSIRIITMHVSFVAKNCTEIICKSKSFNKNLSIGNSKTMHISYSNILLMMFERILLLIEHQPLNFTDLKMPVNVSSKTIIPTVITNPCMGVKNKSNPAAKFDKYTFMKNNNKK